MDNERLKKFLEELKTDLINTLQSKSSYATGQTAKQISITTDINKARLIIPGQLQILESGRKPTGVNVPQGFPSMIERISQWCQSKGISEKGAWAIKKSIDKKGFKGKPGVLTEPLSDENIDRYLDPLITKLADELIELIKFS